MCFQPLVFKLQMLQWMKAQNKETLKRSESVEPKKGNELQMALNEVMCFSLYLGEMDSCDYLLFH